jgi:hypothetical protein
MNPTKDYIYYLSCLSYGLSLLGLLYTEEVKSTWVNRFIVVSLISTPIYGRLFGWW